MPTDVLPMEDGSAAEVLQVTGPAVPIRPSLDPQGSNTLVIVTTG